MAPYSEYGMYKVCVNCYENVHKNPQLFYALELY